MYQVILENIGQVLSRKLLVFLLIVISATAIIYLHHSIGSLPSLTGAEGFNKTDIIFPFAN